MDIKSLPYDWVKHIASSLAKLDDTPLTGYSPPFPWEALNSRFSQLFELEDFKVSPSSPQWRSEEELTTGFGPPLRWMHFTVSPLEGNIYWLIAEEDIVTLMSWLLTKKAKTFPFPDPDFKEGFLYFLAVEVINQFSHLDYDPTLSPKLLPEKQAVETPALCLDITMAFRKKKVWGRLAISPEFQKSWKKHYTQNKPPLSPQDPRLGKLEIPVHLEVGKTSVSFDELSKIAVGDFILLDSCSLDPDKEKGRVLLTVNNAPFFLAQLKEGKIKILERPLNYEVETQMAKKNEKMENPEESFEEFEETELEEETEFEEDTEFEEETEIGEEPTEEKEELKEEAEETLEKEEKKEEPPKEKVEKGFSPENLPLNLVIEVGRLHMSVQKLMDLQPGNLLELNVSPESGVDLVVNGKCIGKGELIRLGDTLGIRVLDLGN